MDNHFKNDWIIQHNVKQFANATDLDDWAIANSLEDDEIVNLRRLELLSESIQPPQTYTSFTEDKDHQMDDWFQQNQPQLSTKDFQSIAEEFEVMQTQTEEIPTRLTAIPTPEEINQQQMLVLFDNLARKFKFELVNIHCYDNIT